MRDVPPGHQRRQIHGWSIRWDDALASESYEGGWWRDETLGDLAGRLAATEPERLLIVDGVRRLDAQTLYREARSLARAFQDRGYQAGTVVSFMLPNWHEAGVIYLAATLTGLVVHPLVPAYREAEVAFMLRDSGSRILFIPREFRGTDYVAIARGAIGDFENPPELVTVRGESEDATSYQALIESEPAASLPRVDPNSVKMLLYTSGTTGRPKGVLHSHNSLCATITQLHRYWQASAGDVFFVPSPVGHIGGSLYAFDFPVQYRTVAVLQDVWDAKQAVSAIDREGCTHVSAATPFLHQILAVAREQQTSLPSLRFFLCGGASVPPSLIREASDYFRSCIVTRAYGLTEVPTITIGSVNPGDVSRAAETDGQIGIAEVKLVDAAGRAVADEGEVVSRGPQMLVGYLRQEDEAESYDPDGFFRTGDIAQRVDGNFLRVSGRRKDIIIRQGENISPKEVEDLLVLHPQIAEVAIVGLPSPRTGELACAVIVPHEGMTPDLEALRAFLMSHRVAKFKIPERVVLRDALPRNAAGKVLKTQLRADLIAEVAGPHAASA